MISEMDGESCEKHIVHKNLAFICSGYQIESNAETKYFVRTYYKIL